MYTNRGFIETDHGADIRIKIWAPTFEQLLEEAIKALGNLIACKDKDLQKISKTLFLKSSTKEELIVTTLEELLFLFEKEGFIPLEGKVMDLSNKYKVKIKVKGRYLEEEEPTKNIIKGVTFHGLKITTNGNKIFTYIVFDV